MTSTLQDRLRDMLPGLPAELQRAARWALDNPAEVGLWSMRRQAQAVGVAPATMLRMARAAGCDTYEAFRAPFQRALTQGMEAGWRDRAARLQAGAPKRPLWTRAPPSPAGRPPRWNPSAPSTPTPPSTKPPPRCWPPARPASWHPLGLRHRLPDALCLPDAVPQRHADRRPGRRLLRRGRYPGPGRRAGRGDAGALRGGHARTGAVGGRARRGRDRADRRPTSPILPFARHVLRFARPRMRPATRADPLRSSTARRACSAWPST